MTLDEKRALAWALRLAVSHSLSHETDEHRLSLAIELIKTIRDEPERIPLMFERWELEPDLARAEVERLHTEWDAFEAAETARA